MIETIMWLIVIAVLSIFAFVIIGFAYASIYDAWYRRKYGAWIVLQENHNSQKRSAAK